MSAFNLRLSVLALCLWTASAILGVPSGELVIGVDNGLETSVTIPSRNGCREILRCTGNGSSIEWRRIGSRRPVMMTEGNKMITTMMRETGVDGQFAFTSYLVFDPIEIGDAGMWKCTIDSLSYTADISIEADLASPSPEPASHNLSSLTIGDTLRVSCSVDTCFKNITVHIVRSGEIIRTQRVRAPEEVAPEFNLDVDEELAGREFACRAVLNVNGQAIPFEETFEVTGVPQPQPVTVPPTTMRSEGGGGGGGKGGGQSVMYSHTLTLGLVILLLAIAIFFY